MKKLYNYACKLLAGITCVICITFNASAQDWTQTNKAVANDRQAPTTDKPSTNFGQAVTISGNYAFVGSSEDGGAVHIYRLIGNQWSLVQRLVPPEGSGFGTPIDADGGYLLVANGVTAFLYRQNSSNPDVWELQKKLIDRIPGAYTSGAIDGDNIVLGGRYDRSDANGGNYLENAGAAYIFNKNQGGNGNWGLVRKITAPVRTPTNFGYTVAISGDHIAVGSTSAANIFRKDKGGAANWGFVQSISANVPNYKYPVALDSNYLAVGLPLDSQNGVGETGSVLIWKRAGTTDSWTQTQKLIAAQPVGEAQFGDKVGIENGVLAVGAYPTNANRGAMHVAIKSTSGEQWSTPKLLSIAAGSPAYLGSTLDMSGNYIIAGSLGEDVPSGSGAAHIFQKNLGGTNNWGEQQRLYGVASAGYSSENDEFGTSVAISGNYAITGAIQHDGGRDSQAYKEGAGAAYILEKQGNSWKTLKRLYGMPRNTGDKFGYSVAIWDTLALVGSPYEGAKVNRGAVYVFSKNQGGPNNWGLLTKMVVPPPAIEVDSNYLFGFSVAINATNIAIGATGNSVKQGDNYIGAAGTVYIYERSGGAPATWNLVTQVASASPHAFDHFGTSVALTDNHLFVGSPDEDFGLTGNTYVNNTGIVYVFSKNQCGPNSWCLQKRFARSTRTSGDRFGLVVSANGNYALATSVAGKGSATIFKKTNTSAELWEQLTVLETPEGTPRNLFGYAAAMGANHAVVGAYAESGKAYIFKKDMGGKDVWGQEQVITPTSTALEDRFGFSVGISGNTIIAGAPWEDQDATEGNTVTNAGAVYFFETQNPNPASVYRYNAGGAAYTSQAGELFYADQFYTGTSQVTTTTGDILNTSDDPLYLNSRVGSAFGYQFDVPNGTYNVVLHFVEPFWGVPGKGGSPGTGRRRFNVDIEGNRKLTNYDIFAMAGGAMRVRKESIPVTIVDGVLNIDLFAGAADKPIIAALEFLPAGQSVTVGPIADAYTRGAPYESANYGSSQTLDVKAGGLISYERDTYLKFSLAGIGSVASAKLRIYGNNVQNTSNVNLAVRSVQDDSWTETGITRQNRPAYGNLLGEVPVSSTAGYYEVDVTAYVQSQFSTDKIAGFVLTDNQAQNIQLTFNSRENPANQPQLVISLAGGITARVAAAEDETVQMIPSVIFPNPAQSGFTVMLSGEHSGPIDLKMTDLNGFNVPVRQEIQGRTARVSISNPALTTGIYLIKIKSNAHSEVVKVLINK